MKLKKRLKQIFCMHIKWELYSTPKNAEAIDVYVWKCKKCGKLRLGRGLRL